MKRKPFRDITKGQRFFVFLVLCAPFFINDFGFIALNGSYQIYLPDYATRILVIGLCFIWPLSRAIATEKLHHQSLQIVLVLAAIVIPVSVHIVLDPAMAQMSNPLGWEASFSYPKIQNLWFRWFDLTIGLFIVALSEELVARKFALSWLSRITLNNIITIIVSALIFAGLHWSQGPISIVKNFIMGMVFMALYLKVKKLWPLIVAHWIINFLVFY